MSIDANLTLRPQNSISAVPLSLLEGEMSFHSSAKSPSKINGLLHNRREKRWSHVSQSLDTSPTRYPPAYQRFSPTSSPTKLPSSRYLSVSPVGSPTMSSHSKYPSPTRSMASSPTSVRSYGYDTPELHDIDYYPCYDFLTSERNVDASAMIYSRATYGMLLQTLEKIIEAQPNAWVVCVRYKPGDTQICFGGKVPVGVSNVDACVMESKEEA